MKTKLLIILLILFFSENLVNSQELNSKNTQKRENNINLIGDYNLLSYKVKISDKGNKLILILPSISKPLENFYNMVSDYSSNIPMKIFPRKGEFELVKIKDSLYMIKDSNGFSIEITNKDLIFRDSNFEILNQRTFNNLISLYETLYSPAMKSTNTARQKSVEANMYTIQLAVETFAYKFKGLYPESIISLEKIARQNGFWKEIKNPYLLYTDYKVKENIIIDFKNYNNSQTLSKLKGLVVYEPLSCEYIDEFKERRCNSYQIYGTDHNGHFIKIEDDTLILNNE